MELFFDLVYVFAITQLSHFLLHRLDFTGAVETLILFLAIWWAWIFTAWVTNWLDPDRAAIRLMLVCVMLGSLVLAAAIPEAFGADGLRFAIAYVAIQIGRTMFAAWVIASRDRANGRNMVRAAMWFGLAAIFWILGGLTAGAEDRLILWAVAIGIEYLGPIVNFRFPGFGASTTRQWNVSGGHLAERCALLIIIALGEGILVTGATFAEGRAAPGALPAFLVAFLSSVAMWWIYFDVGARRGSQHIEHHDDPGAIARLAFTYWHIPIVAGIIVFAVTDELLLAHPQGRASPQLLWVLVGGGGLFLGGTMVFKRISSGNPWFPLSHIVGLSLFALIALWGIFGRPSALAVAGAAMLAFMMVAAWEWGSLNGGWIERIEARGGLPGRALRRVSDWLRARAQRRRHD